MTYTDTVYLTLAILSAGFLWVCAVIWIGVAAYWWGTGQDE